MKKDMLKADFILIFVAIIWGFSFVAQKDAMNSIGPFLFNGIRFSLAVIFLIPVYLIKNKKNHTPTNYKSIISSINNHLKKLLATGIVLFIAANLQQVGIIDTTAGKAGFITGLYVVLVPILGLFLKHKTNLGSWLGAVLAVIGLYLLSINDDFAIGKGDLIVLIGAFCWAIHVLLIDSLSKKVDSLFIAIFQFGICGILSLIIGLIFEIDTISNIFKVIIPILYGGLLSVGVAYTLQIVAQKNAHPSHAAIILSMESVFSIIGGYFILGELLDTRQISGCLIILAGMILSQLYKYWKKPKTNIS